MTEPLMDNHTGAPNSVYRDAALRRHLALREPEMTEEIRPARLLALLWIAAAAVGLAAALLVR